MSEAACDDIEEHQDLSNEGSFIDMKQLFLQRALIEEHFCYGRPLLLWKTIFVMKAHFCYESSLLLQKLTFVVEAHFCELLLWKFTFDMEVHF